jgi:hypothetical protein
MQEIEQRGLGKIERRFAELRDELLAASHEFAKSENRDWARAEVLFAASKKVDELCKSVLTPPESEEIGQVSVTHSRANGAPALHSPDRGSRKRSKKDYPKYVMRSDSLIKIGLSRDRRTEYEHTVPHSEFEAVIERLAELAGRKHFSADDVIEKVPSPSYQVYIVLSLLKKYGLLTVPRRGMYAFGRTKNFVNETKSIWQALEHNKSKNSNE